MRTLTKRAACLSVALTLALASVPANAAGVFNQADALFAQRDNNAANVAAARAEYLRILPTVSGADLAYAVQQIGMLATYEGTYLIPDATANYARKAQIFDECRKTAAKLEGQADQITVHAFWRISCTALWLKYASTIQRLAELSAIKTYFNNLVDANLEIKPELNIDLRYQGGGMNRALSAIYSNPLASLIRDGLPNGAKALDMADRALRSRAFPGDPNQGADYYRNYRHKAEALNLLHREPEGQMLLASTITEITERQTDNDLPANIEPETKGELAVMQTMHHAFVGE